MPFGFAAKTTIAITHKSGAPAGSQRAGRCNEGQASHIAPITIPTRPSAADANAIELSPPNHHEQKLATSNKMHITSIIARRMSTGCSGFRFMTLTLANPHQDCDAHTWSGRHVSRLGPAYNQTTSKSSLQNSRVGYQNLMPDVKAQNASGYHFFRHLGLKQCFALLGSSGCDSLYTPPVSCCFRCGKLGKHALLVLKIG